MSESPQVVQAVGVSKRYPGVQALSQVDLSVAEGEVRALLGANGAGKSTLIRMLSGAETPDEGTIRIGGTPLTGGIKAAAAAGVATVYQELSLIPEMTIAENMFLGRWPGNAAKIDRRAMTAAAGATLRSFGLTMSPHRPVDSLTLAEQQIVEIVRAVREDPRLLILDEPTSALAASEVDLVLRVVKEVSARGVAVIYVSHRMDEIRQIADSVSVMRDGRHVSTEPIKGASTAHIIDLMLGGAHDAAGALEPNPLGDVKLKVTGLVSPPKVRGIDLEVRAGEVLGIAGLLGSGRSELLRAIAGFDAVTAGEVVINGVSTQARRPRKAKALGLGLTPENRKAEGIIADLSIADNIILTDYAKVTKAGVLQGSEVGHTTEGLKSRLAIKAASMQRPIRTLSGGNQQKAVIGRWLHAGSDVLLLDEPTRGVDVGSKAQIYDIVRGLAADGAAVLFVSSELEELPLVCDRVVVMRGGQLTDEFHAPHITNSDLLAAAMGTDSTKEN